jgi:glutathionyl-hydroquinone reductase
MFNELEQRFADGRYFLFGDGLTDADIRLFVTLVRFDPAYHGLFRASLRRLADYPRFSAYLERTLAVPGVRETVNRNTSSVATTQSRR